MNLVRLLTHSHDLEDGHEDVKIVGVFESRKAAAEAILIVADQPGFRDHPGGFSIDQYQVGDIHWKEGFASA